MSPTYSVSRLAAMSSQSTFSAPGTWSSPRGRPSTPTASSRALSPESLWVHSSPRRVREATRPDSSAAAGVSTRPVTRARSSVHSGTAAALGPGRGRLGLLATPQAASRQPASARRG